MFCGTSRGDVAAIELHQGRVVEDQPFARFAARRVLYSCHSSAMIAGDSSTALGRLSSARMRLFVHGPQSVPSHVSVDLRRSHIGVTQQLLDRSQIGTSFEEMSSKCVPKCMRMQRAAVGERKSVQDPPRVTRREPSPARFTKSASVGLDAAASRAESSGTDIVRHRPARRVAERAGGAPSHPCPAR